MVASALATDPFKPATREQLFLRMAITGPAGSGKTWTAMAIAAELGKVAVIDTEHGSARKYGKEFTFNVIELPTYDPREYIKYIKAAAQFGYDVVVIDSLSHAWNATGGILDMVDKKAKSSTSGNKFTAWADATPIHNLLIEAILSTPVHIIATMRSKTEYVMEKNHQGKEVPRKVGLAPIQRDGMEFEFDIVAEMDMENNFMVSKSRCSALHNAVITKPGKNVAEIVKGWLTDGEPVPDLKLIEQASSDLESFLHENDVEVGGFESARDRMYSAMGDKPRPAKVDIDENGQDIIVEPTAPDKPRVSLREYLVNTVEHPYYSSRKHLSNAISKMFEADILHDSIERDRAVMLMMSLANLRENGTEPADAVVQVRQIANDAAKGESA